MRGRETPVGSDVIVGIDGTALHSHEELQCHLIVETRPGEELAVELVRNGEQVVERATLGERPSAGLGRSTRENRWSRRIPIE